MQKKNMLNRQKKVGLGQTPPLVWEKFPRFIVFFLEDLPYNGDDDDEKIEMMMMLIVILLKRSKPWARLWQSERKLIPQQKTEEGTIFRWKS